MEAPVTNFEFSRIRACESHGICLASDEFSRYRGDQRVDEENFDPSMRAIKTESPSIVQAKLKDRRSSMKRQTSSRRRRRRRSSARFLKIIPSNNDDDGGDGERINYDGANTTNLGEVYRNAIRMNAENRINASNSWNLNLIDHLDRFVAPELRDGTSGKKSKNHAEAVKGSTTSRTNINSKNGMESIMDSTIVSGVNFTKASCTLDASVKIYSYRVDDVHLTSYKVLANLNRTDNSTSSKSNGTTKNFINSSDESSNDCENNNGDETSSQNVKPKENTNSIGTLELNTANINIHKIDAAFDIDPLFHKMSKTFDEGGAKGLLLANLGVGSSGCNIVFDSTLDDEDAALASLAPDIDHNESNKEGEEDLERENIVTNSNLMVDVSSLTCKLESLLCKVSGNSSSIENMLLVPQLASLRNQYAELGKDGFVKDEKKCSKRYASSLKDENEADKSIHLEAIERSRISQGDLIGSQNFRDSLGSYDSHEDGNFVEGGIDFDVDDDDVFGDIHDGDHRFSSSSFAPARVSFTSTRNVENSSNVKIGNLQTTIGSRHSPPQTYSQASLLLDAIASGDISTQQHNHYEYFNSQTLKNLTTGNLWAGAEHWKKMPSSGRRQDRVGVNRGIHIDKTTRVDDGFLPRSKKMKKFRSKKTLKSASNRLPLVSISKPIEKLDVLMEKPKRKRGKNTRDFLQLTKAIHTKCSNVDNLLPMDAGLQVREFIALFSRPNTDLIDFLKTKSVETCTADGGKSAKNVGFSGVETWEADDASGNGFDFGGSDDEFEEKDNLNEFVVPSLEDVRRVDKIQIGYATVARKIDVKRLKRDLWNGLEQTFLTKNLDNAEADTSKKGEGIDLDLRSPSKISEQDLRLENAEGTGHDEKEVEICDDVSPLSFQETVHNMEINQSQSDVTVPFYFICILHLCNEKGLALESSGLNDFVIHSG